MFYSLILKFPKNTSHGFYPLLNQFIVLVFVLSVTSACSTVPTGENGPLHSVPDVSIELQCERWLKAVDRVVLSSGAGDARAQQVPGFPHMRVNRPLLHLNRQIQSDEQTSRWLTLLARLGLEARHDELANVDSQTLSALHSSLPDSDALAALMAAGTQAQPVSTMTKDDRATLIEATTGCHHVLTTRDIADPTRSMMIRKSASVPDNYSKAKRLLGLYWLTKYGVAAGINGYESETSDTFLSNNEPLLPKQYQYSYSDLTSENVLSVADIAQMLASAERDAFDRPVLSEQAEQQLLKTLVPVFMVERKEAFDDPGTVILNEQGGATIDPQVPVIYSHLTYADDNGTQLVQLVYTLWFAERPARSAFDIYAGNLDGVTLRITLNQSGQPAVVDSIHPCGCYHQFFHTGYAVPLARPDNLSSDDEWRFMPTTQLSLPSQATRPRLTVLISSGEHYLKRVSFESAASEQTTHAALVSDKLLTSLPLGATQQRRSLYAPDGIIPGTDRPERWLLWPMGIKSAGAMRQPGTQATAFVGLRHFDDGDIIDSRFDVR